MLIRGYIMPRTKPSIAVLLRELANVTSDALSIDTIVTKIRAHHALGTRNPQTQIHTLLHDNPLAVGWIALPDHTFLAVHQAVNGVTFRIIPDVAAINGDYLLREWLEPFVSADDPIYVIGDGQPLAQLGPDIVALNGWYARHGAQIGDHLIVRIDVQRRHHIHLSLDDANTQHLADARDAERQLIDALFYQKYSSPSYHTLAHAVLLTYARASWRSAYPGRPWHVLVNEAYATNTDAVPVPSRLTLLHQEIAALQQQLRTRRSVDSDNGLWNGVVLRYSAVRLFIDTSSETPQRGRVEPIDARIDYTKRINDAIARGLYDVQYDDDPRVDGETISFGIPEMPMDDDDDSDDDYASALYSDDDDDDDDETEYEYRLPSADEDLDDETFTMLFANRHPALEAWSERLLKSMLPMERRRMIRAETDEDYNAILTMALQRIIPQNPQFMATLRAEPNPPHDDPTAGGKTYAAFEVVEYIAAQTIQATIDHDATNDDDIFGSGGEAVFAVELALRESSAQITRFETHLQATGLSQSTIRRKVQVLFGLAQFLARYYTKSLTDVTYAMYDEYLFFHYPRHHTNRAARGVRTLISTLREFNQNCAQTSDTHALSAADAMYACRAQAEQVLALLIRIQQYPHELTTLVVHLFAPYTA